MTLLAVWLVGAALTFWLAERELVGRPARNDGAIRRARREIALVSVFAWPCALAIYLLSIFGVFGDDEEGA